MSRPGNIPATRMTSISKARRAGVRPGDARGFGAGFEVIVDRARREDAHIAPPHAEEPQGGHGGARAVIVGEHDARPAHRRVTIGRLDQLSARRVAASRQVSGFVFLRAADIEQVERAFVGFAAPAVEGFGAGEAHAGLAGVRSGLLRPGAGGAGKRRRASSGAAFEREAGQFPTHRPVLQRDDGVGAPASIRDWAPTIERVRPAQVTATRAPRSGAKERARCTSSAPGRRPRRGRSCGGIRRRAGSRR